MPDSAYGSGMAQRAHKALKNRKRAIDAAVDAGMSKNSAKRHQYKGEGKPGAKASPMKKKRKIVRDGSSFSHGFN